jgi:hypothetical protein
VRKLSVLLLFFSCLAWGEGELNQRVSVSLKLEGVTEEIARRELLFSACLKSMEKLASGMGYKYDDFNQKLNNAFINYFKLYQEKRLIEKFGVKYKESMSDAEIKSFLTPILTEEHNLFIKFSQIIEALKSHSLSAFTQNKEDLNLWTADVNLEFDKIKLEKIFRRVINDKGYHSSKLIIMSDIDAYQFTWPELELESHKNFLAPLNQSWLKWENENLPTSVAEVRICEESCLSYITKWSEDSSEHRILSDEYADSVLLKVALRLKRVSSKPDLKEATFEWEGRSVLQDLNTKRILASFVIPQEKRTFRYTDQKSLNSALASSLYRSPLTSFLQFKRKLEDNIGFNRVSKLVIKGHSNLGDVLTLIEVIKTRGSSLGLEVFIDAFTKDEAQIACFYRGEEKSFSDVLSGIKELKSSHSYTLVNEFINTHYVIKLITE